MNPNFIISVKRTTAQVVSAWVIAQGARVGIDLPGDAVSDVVFAVLFGVWYPTYRYLEVKFPRAFVILGSAVQPVYESIVATMDIGEDDADE